MKTPIIISISTTILKKNEINYIKKYKPFGVILFSKNIINIIKLKILIKNIKLSSSSTLVFVDQESGIVDRFKFFKDLNFLDNYQYYKIFLKNKELAKTLIFLKSIITAYYLNEWGFDSNTIPVLDLPTSNTAKFISKRTFGPDLKIVKKLNEIIILNNINLGLIPVIKHIPGHGVTPKDSHKVIPTTNFSLKELTPHFNSFKNFNYLPLAMTSHIIYKKIDPDFIATFSSKIIDQIIRSKINFQGLLMSDDLSMKAVKFDFKMICDLSNKLDIDILLDCSDNLDKYIYFSENFKRTDRYNLFVKYKKNWIPKKSSKIINIKDYRDIYDNILRKHGI
jgi:beta-N-acetylhexosaminidase